MRYRRPRKIARRRARPARRPRECDPSRGGKRPHMDRVITDRARAEGVSFEGMRDSYLSKVSLRRMVEAEGASPTSPCSFAPTWPGTSPVKPSAWTEMSNIFDIVGGSVASGRRKVIITCAVTGQFRPRPCPNTCRSRPPRSPSGRSKRRAGGRDRGSVRRQSRGEPDSRPRRFRGIRSRHRRRNRRDRQHHDRRQRAHNDRGSARLSAQGQAGALLPQHGHDEFNLPQGAARGIVGWKHS